jgi:amidase
VTTVSNPADLSASAAATAIRRKELSSRELLDAYLARIEASTLNAVVTVDAERAQEQAGRLDRAAARGEWRGALHGLPFTVKDAIRTAGIRTTSGATELRDHVPSRDATAVARLRGAGGVVLGKTNTPAWCGDVETFNELFGTTRNPWDPARTSGGSSGGSAAAVAARLSAFDLGTDIGGSLRIPPAFCGTFAVKPTFGIVPADGYLDTADGGDHQLDMNVFGPIGRSVADLELLLRVLGGPGEADAPAWRLALPEPRWQKTSDLRVAVWATDPLAPPDRNIASAVDRVAGALSDAGARVTEDRPDLALEQVHDAFMTCLRAETALSHPDGPVVPTHDWLRALRTRSRQRARWSAWFDEVDLLLCPVVPTVAFPHDRRGPSRERRIEAADGTVRLGSSLTVWTGIASSLYLPAAVVPVGWTDDGLPLAVQIIGRRLADRSVLRAAGIIAGLLAPDLVRG